MQEHLNTVRASIAAKKAVVFTDLAPFRLYPWLMNAEERKESDK